MNTKTIVYNVHKVKKLVSREIAKRKGLTQVLFAKSLGTSVSSLFSDNPSADKIAKLANALEVDPNSFFDIPERLMPQPDTNVLTEELIEYEKKEGSLYKELYEKQNEITRLMKLNEKYRILIQKNNISLDEIDIEDNY